MNMTNIIDVGVLMLTARCDMHCAFCIADNGFVDIDPDDSETILEALAHQGIKELVLGGGEPFCWRGDLLSLARSAKKYNFNVQVGTNATHFKASMARCSDVDRWVLPLESPDAKIHDALRPGFGSNFDHVTGAMQACLEAGREITVSTVVSKESLDQLPALTDYLETWIKKGGKLHAWHLYRFQPEGRGGQDNASRFEIPVETYRRQCHALREKHPDLNILLRPDLYRSHQVAFYWREGRRLMRRDREGLTTVLCHLPSPTIAKAFHSEHPVPS